MASAPNIILILTDHFRPDALARDVTPNLWRLASEGARFEHAYCASPLCQPARNSLITGHLPAQTGISGESRFSPEKMSAALGVPDSPRDRERRTHYLEKCRLIDDYVGKLIEALRNREWYDCTTFIFTSDHGENAGDFGIWDKRHFYEQSCGVPLILAGRGVAGEWKLVFDPEAGGVQNLYNLVVDPDELTNLTGVPGYEHIVNELLQGILSHRIRLTQTTQAKEEQRLQRVRIV